MAVLDDLPGISVTVEVKGEEAREYLDSDNWVREGYRVPAGRRKSTYIECLSDADFSIHLRVSPPYKLDCDGLRFKILIDGVRIAHKITPESFDSWSGCILEMTQRRSEEEVVHRKFKFQGIERVEELDENEVACHTKKLDHLGEIIVLVHRITYRMTHCPSSSSHVDKPLKPLPQKVSEKALKGKAVSHGVIYGSDRLVVSPKRPPTEAPPSARRVWCYESDGEKKPLAIFKFKYRDRAGLISELAISRSPSPVVERGIVVPIAERRQTHSEAQDRRKALAEIQKQIAENEEEELPPSVNSLKRVGDLGELPIRKKPKKG